jgi:DNA-binding NtrC family response regulator
MYLTNIQEGVSKAGAIESGAQGVNLKSTEKIHEQSKNRIISKKILVVDDDWMIRDMTSRILKLLGYTVFSFENAVEALSFFMKDPIEVVLTDLEMPGLNGWEFAQNIKEHTPGVPVILMTGTDMEDLEAGLRKGNVDFLLMKPFRLKELDRIIDEAFKARYRISIQTDIQ